MKLLTFFVLILIIIFSSCGKDDTNNITNPPTTDSLIYSKDSLIVYNVSFTGFDIDSLLSHKYRISFDASTNDTSNNSAVEINFYTNQDSIHTIIDDYTFGNQINQSFNKTYTVNS